MTETTLTLQDISNQILENKSLKERIICMEQDLAVAKMKIAELEEEKKPPNLPEVTKSTVMQSDKTVKFYTGLVSTAMFNALLQFVLSIWNPPHRTCLDPEQQLILVLMRLRLGLLTQDLACRFGISACTVSVIFHSWLDVLAENLKKFIIWPSRRSIQTHRPRAFRDPLFDHVRGIIDCTEVFIQRPTVMKARSQTFSSYKHHNTIRLLVVVSPSGAITFVSKAWGGRVSDKELTLHSGLLDMVEEGDVYLVDRGFRCEDMFAARGATLLMPSLTKKRTQLPGAEVTASRKLSSVRIHVERAIRKLKVFRLFQTELPVSFVKRAGDEGYVTIDKIAAVCGGLVNLQTPLINSR
ncbi:uncharacterized protein LOC120837546 [Ixodes scapularis]|uniref:uncharacterized protein LOC120837546 n=1 Tax=Ixodes scapularis TaxID=6945 RepID=UPI001A9E1E38|nr:uncharacterized protein LOC120837546 [Ixodes scapularis]